MVWRLICPKGNEYEGKCVYQSNEKGFFLHCPKLKKTKGDALSCGEDSHHSKHRVTDSHSYITHN